MQCAHCNTPMRHNMHEWIDDLRHLREAGKRAVIVTVAGVRGSAPREIGAKMLVSDSDTLGTIGGGQLEYQCTKIACELLQDAAANVRLLRRFPLGANCGQCCGGVVDVLFEECAHGPGWFDDLLRGFDSGQELLMLTRFASSGDICKEIVSADQLHATGKFDLAVTEAGREVLDDGNARHLKLSAKSSVLLEPVMASRFDIAVFGAGHVGTATVAMLATLDCNIRWVDSRRKVLPKNLPANVQTIRTDTPEREVAAMPANAFYLIMTHSHPMDYEICCEVLKRGDATYCGLIGSKSKQRRFTKRLRAGEIGNIEQLTCPIGVGGISGKKPAEIAISVAAEILQVREAASQSAAGSPDGNVFHIKSRY